MTSQARVKWSKRSRVGGHATAGLVLGLVVTTGCEPSEGPLGTAISDSAGVRVVEIGPGLGGAVRQLVLASEPDLIIRFREDDPALVVSGITDVQLLSQGRIAVANEVASEILVFDSAGRHIDTWGGAGAGPGEFGRLEWLAPRPPDSLAAGDARLRRVTILDSDGTFVRNLGGIVGGGSPSSIPPRPLGLFSDGSVIAAFFAPVATAVEGPVRPEVEVVVIPPSGEGLHSVGTWPGDELSLFRQDGLLQVVAPPFGRRLHISAKSDGLWVGDDASWEIHGYSSEGQLRTIVRALVSPGLVSDDLLEQRIAEKYRGRVSDAASLARLTRDQRRIAHHTTMPSLGTVVGMTGGGVAIGEYRWNTASPRAWFMVDSMGRVAAIDLPPALEVKRLGPDWVIGVVRDELDREEIHRYPILEGRGGR